VRWSARSGGCGSRLASGRAAAAAFVLVALLGVALVTVRSGSEQRLALPAGVGPLPRAVEPTREVPRPRLLAPFGPLRQEVTPAGALAGSVDRAGFAAHSVGVIFLFIGLVGLIVTLLYWSPWVNGRPGNGIEGP
jgi:hypothetical protein